MFDFGKLVDTVTSYASGSGTGTGDGLEPILQQLADLGVDPAQFQGLAPQEILDVLAQLGIDTSGLDLANLDGGQLVEMLGQIGGGSETIASAGQWLSDRLTRS